jgi:hypothetical protein
MAVGMGMRLPGRIGWPVIMLMVFVVTMQMVVLQGLVDVIVFVMFGQMQPDARNHEQKRRPEKERRNFAQDQKREDDTDKRGRGKVSAGTRGTQIT